MDLTGINLTGSIYGSLILINLWLILCGSNLPKGWTDRIIKMKTCMGSWLSENSWPTIPPITTKPHLRMIHLGSDHQAWWRTISQYPQKHMFSCDIPTKYLTIHWFHGKYSTSSNNLRSQWVGILSVFPLFPTHWLLKSRVATHACSSHSRASQLSVRVLRKVVAVGPYINWNIWRFPKMEVP